MCVLLCALYSVCIFWKCNFEFPSLWLSHEWYILVDKCMMHRLCQVSMVILDLGTLAVSLPLNSIQPLCGLSHSVIILYRLLTLFSLQGDKVDPLIEQSLECCFVFIWPGYVAWIISDLTTIYNYVDLLIINNFCLFFPEWLGLTTQNSMPNTCQITQTQIDY